MTWAKDGEYAIRSGKWRITKNWTADGWLYAVIRDGQVVATAATAELAKGKCK